MWGRVSTNTDYHLCEEEGCEYNHPMAEWWRYGVSSIDGLPMIVPVDACNADEWFEKALESGKFVNLGIDGSGNKLFATPEVAADASLVKEVKRYMGCEG